MDEIINKVDHVLKNKVNEITKDGKIHSIKGNKITTDNESKRENKNNSKVLNQSYLVQAEKREKYEVEAFEGEDENKKLGRFIDIKE